MRARLIKDLTNSFCACISHPLVIKISKSWSVINVCKANSSYPSRLQLHMLWCLHQWIHIFIFLKYCPPVSWMIEGWKVFSLHIWITSRSLSSLMRQKMQYGKRNDNPHEFWLAALWHWTHFCARAWVGNVAELEKIIRVDWTWKCPEKSLRACS